MDDETFQNALVSWRRWSLTQSWASMGLNGLVSLTPCESAERAYSNRSDLDEGEPGQVDDSAKRAILGPLNARLAHACEDAWRQLDMPDKLMLRYAILWRESDKATCRRLGVHWTAYDILLAEALNALREQVERANRSYIPEKPEIG